MVSEAIRLPPTDVVAKVPVGADRNVVDVERKFDLVLISSGERDGVTYGGE